MIRGGLGFTLRNYEAPRLRAVNRGPYMKKLCATAIAAFAMAMCGFAAPSRADTFVLESCHYLGLYV